MSPTQRDSKRSAGSSKTKKRRSASQSQNSISEVTRERLVNDCVRYFLVVDSKKTPIKRQDILNNVLKEQPKSFNAILEDAGRKLKEVFGFNLVELSKKGLYIIVAEEENNPAFSASWSQNQSAQRGLLFLVLTTIYMNGNTIQEDQLWRMLRKFGVDSTDTMHDLFGDVKKLLTKEFVQQRYLEYKLIQGREPPSYEFLWGERAELELSKDKVLELVCKIYKDGRKPSDWTTRYKEACDQW